MGTITPRFLGLVLVALIGIGLALILSAQFGTQSETGRASRDTAQTDSSGALPEEFIEDFSAFLRSADPPFEAPEDWLTYASPYGWTLRYPTTWDVYETASEVLTLFQQKEISEGCQRNSGLRLEMFCNDQVIVQSFNSLEEALSDLHSTGGVATPDVSATTTNSLDDLGKNLRGTELTFVSPAVFGRVGNVPGTVMVSLAPRSPPRRWVKRPTTVVLWTRASDGSAYLLWQPGLGQFKANGQERAQIVDTLDQSSGPSAAFGEHVNPAVDWSVSDKWQTVRSDVLGASLSVPPNWTLHEDESAQTVRVYSPAKEFNRPICEQITAYCAYTALEPDVELLRYDGENLSFDPATLFDPDCQECDGEPLTIGGYPAVHVEPDDAMAPVKVYYIQASDGIYQLMFGGEAFNGDDPGNVHFNRIRDSLRLQATR